MSRMIFRLAWAMFRAAPFRSLLLLAELLPFVPLLLFLYLTDEKDPDG